VIHPAVFLGIALGQTTIPWNSAAPNAVSRTDGRLESETWTSEDHRQVVVHALDPKLPSHRFVLRTRAQGGVTPEGRILFEMTVVQPDGTRAVVRTVDTGGPMAPLKGAFDRSIELPFVSDPSHPPKELLVEMVSRGGIKIVLEPLTLEPWPHWNLTWMAAGGFGAALGMLLGLLGGVYGLLAAIPALRPAALAFGRLGAASAFLMLVVSLVLYLTSWPFGIWVSMAVGGALMLLIFAGTRPMVRKGIEAADRLRSESGGTLEAS
jgi:hypothetical protein